MKYIMYEQDLGDIKRKVPIIFPDSFVHRDINQMIKAHPNYRDLKPVSAGQCVIDCSGTFGDSETMNLESKKDDKEVIMAYDYLHGL
jgi:hypothetical protein